MFCFILHVLCVVSRHLILTFVRLFNLWSDNNQSGRYFRNLSGSNQYYHSDIELLLRLFKIVTFASHSKD